MADRWIRMGGTVIDLLPITTIKSRYSSGYGDWVIQLYQGDTVVYTHLAASKEEATNYLDRITDLLNMLWLDKCK